MQLINIESIFEKNIGTDPRNRPIVVKPKATPGYFFNTDTISPKVMAIVILKIIIPISEIVIKIMQYILGKIVKPKVIPKLYFRDDIPEKYTTMVVIPTILDSK